MHLQIGETKITVSFLFWICIAFVLCFDNGYVLPCMVAVCAHEGAHLFAMRLCGAGIRQIRLEGFGIIIEKDCVALSAKQKISISLAGSWMNVGLFFLCFLWSKIGANEAVLCFAVLNLVLGVMNLFPIKGLDGAEVISLVFCEVIGLKNGETIAKIVSIVCCGLWLLIGTIICFKIRLNPSLLLFPLFLLLQSIFYGNYD